MANKNSSRQKREVSISCFLSSYDHGEVIRAMKGSATAKKRYAKVAKIIPILAKEMLEGEVVPLMGIFEWEVDIIKSIEIGENTISQCFDVHSPELSSLIFSMQECKLFPIFSFCIAGEYSSSGYTCYVIKLPKEALVEDVSNDTSKLVAELEELIAEFDVMTEIEEFFSGL